MDIENFEMDNYDEDELANKLEAQLQNDEVEVTADNDCGGACAI